MDALRRGGVHAADDVLIDLLRDERDHRRGAAADGIERRVERHVRIDRVLRHLLVPEALTAAADVPVRQLVHKVLHRLGGLRDAVAVQVLVRGADHRVHPRQEPLVHDGERRRVQRVLRRVELMDLRVEDIESIGVPEGVHELALSLDDDLVVELVRQPRLGVRVEIPPDRVGAELVERGERVDGVALALGHLLAVLI